MSISAKQNKKNKFGQYFTPKIVAEFMVYLANITHESKILEPSCGEGVFLDILRQKGFTNLSAYEIDNTLAISYPNVKYESFISAEIQEKYDLIIGNPPYIRWKNLEDELKQELTTHLLWNKYFNSLCDYLYIFILKSIELLEDGGQLIFICPEYWMNTTHSLSLRNYMIQNGYFEIIYHFNETPIFEKATVSTIIFKYIKGKNKKESIKVAKFYANHKLTAEVLDKLKNEIPFADAEYFEIPQFKVNERWILQPVKIQEKIKVLENACLNIHTLLPLFDDIKQGYNVIGDCCDIGNGLVSGLDKAFQVNGETLNENEYKATIDVVKAKDIKPFFTENITKYIYIPDNLDEKQFKVTYPNFYNHFQKFRPDLENRYQYSKKANYWEWVFLRNFNLFNKKEKRILVPCKERISNKEHFRFALAGEDVFPTQDVTAILKKPKTKESIEYILAYLNIPIIFDWLKCNGIVKGNIVEFSEKPVASIPFRTIDWENEEEVEIHNNITDLTKQYLTLRENTILLSINQTFDKLLNR